MKMLFRVIAGLTATVVLVVAGVLTTAFVGTSRALAHRDEIPAARLALRPGAVGSAERGQALIRTRGCTDCHGDDLGGKTFIDDGGIGTYAGTNLTALGAAYSDADWIRAIRYGLRPDGSPLVFMPSHEFTTISDADMASLLAHIRSLGPVARDNAPVRIGVVARVLYLMGEMPILFPYRLVDRQLDPPLHVEPAPTADYGAYLAAGCVGCHGPTYKGGPIPGTPPDWPPAADITATGAIAQWTLAQFTETLRTGVTPAGRQIDAAYMPWPGLAHLSDVETEALYLYLRTRP